MSAGGEATWRDYLTLPNILKEFNPGLKGYSVGKGEFLAPNSHMNVAFPVSADFDAYRQAQFLTKKMKRDPDIDLKNDWKVMANTFSAHGITHTALVIIRARKCCTSGILFHKICSRFISHHVRNQSYRMGSLKRIFCIQ